MLQFYRGSQHSNSQHRVERRAFVIVWTGIHSVSDKWQVKATDILAMLQSFLRKGQQVKKVTVYPSDYGLQRMAEEARFGPQGLATSKASANSGNANAAMAIPRNGNEGASNGGTTKRGKGFSLSKEERAAILETLNEQDSGGEGGKSDANEFCCACMPFLLEANSDIFLCLSLSA